MGAKILYADDEANYRRLVRLFLEREGFQVLTAPNGEAALDLAMMHPDLQLAILDVMMPGLDGWAACRELKKLRPIPILMLTALGDEKSEVFGMDNGSDDYIAKPFTYELLVAHVKALLRRSRAQEQTLLSDEGLAFDEATGKVCIDGDLISLTPREFELLKWMVLNKGRVLTRQQLLDGVWGHDFCGDPRTVDTHIKSLRAKLGEVGIRLVTLRHRGYCYRGVSE